MWGGPSENTTYPISMTSTDHIVFSLSFPLNKSLKHALLKSSLSHLFYLHSSTLQLHLNLRPFLPTPMDEFYWRSHVPAFGSWDCNDDLPFTQCFESARQAGLLRHSYSQDRDLYVAGDLYDNDLLTPAVIVIPRRRGKAVYPREREEKKDAWAMCDCDCQLSSPPSPTPRRAAPKAVDEDLYKISPHLLRQQAKRKKGWGIFSSCLRPCVC